MFDKLIDLLVQWLGLFKFWTVVEQSTVAWVLRFGRAHRELEPGLHWTWPLAIESKQTVDMRPGTEVLDAQSVACADGQPVVLRLVVTWRVADSYRYAFGGPGGTAVQDVALGAAGDCARSMPRADLLAGKGQQKVLAAARRRAREYGIRIDSVHFADCAAARSLRLWQTQTTSAGQE